MHLQNLEVLRETSGLKLHILGAFMTTYKGDLFRDESHYEQIEKKDFKPRMVTYILRKLYELWLLSG